jgi:glutathione-regulated potassium-efflux system ancillary protein KefC
MSETWLVATLWVGLALAASLLSMWLRIATALCEIVVGTIAQLAIGVAIGGAPYGGQGAVGGYSCPAPGRSC